MDKYCIKITPEGKVLVLLTDGSVGALQSHVGGFLEIVKSLHNCYTFLKNTEGIIIKKQRNHIAEHITGNTGVYGNLLIAGPITDNELTFFSYETAERIATDIAAALNGKSDNEVST